MSISAPNQQALAGFVDYLKVEKGLARLSVEAYVRDLTQFADFLHQKKPTRALLRARRQDVRDFLDRLFSHQVDGRSVARKLSAMRHFYKYLLLDRMIENDPTLNIDTPRQWKVLPKALSREETENLLKPRPARPEDPGYIRAIATRDRAMLEMLYGGALRVSEVVGVALNDLKLEQGYVLVRGKGDKERIVPMGRAAIEALQEYLSGARPVLAGQRSSPLLFIARGAPRFDATAGVANGASGVAGEWESCIAAHAATQLRDAHGGERRRPANRADDPRARGYFDDAGVHAHRHGPAEDGVPEASSAGEEEGLRVLRDVVRGQVSSDVQHAAAARTPVEKGIANFVRSLKERNASPHTVHAYSRDLGEFAAYVGEAKWDAIDHVRIRGIPVASL